MTHSREHMIAPSLLSADFSNLRQEISKVEKGGADVLHLDVMDGHFVPNITIGPVVVSAIRRTTTLPLDCHLMIESPSNYIEAFAKAGATMISVHCETQGTRPDILGKIKSLGVKAGIAINPETPIAPQLPFIERADYVLIMSVHPGFGGQIFIASSVQKVKDLRALRDSHNLSFDIEVDGGIHMDNIASLAQAGANIFVAGSAIFKSDDYQKTIMDMKEKING